MAEGDSDTSGARAPGAGRPGSGPAASTGPTAGTGSTAGTGPTAGAVGPGRRHARRRRDRRGRGLRGLLVTSDVPIRRSRAERFDDLVLDAVEHLELRWSDQLSNVEFAVEDVPPVPPVAGAEPVPLTRFIPPAGSGRASVPARIVVYRRPLEARALDREDLAELVLDVIVHEVADMLGVEPEVIDPEGHGYDDEDE